MNQEELTLIQAGLSIPNGEWPSETLAEAAEHVVELEPWLLGILRAALADPEEYATAHKGPLQLECALILLAHARCTAAHPLVLQLCALPENTADMLLDDFIGDQANLVLWKTSGGDLTGITRLADDVAIHPYARDAALGALNFAWAEGALSREELYGRLRQALESAAPEVEGYYLPACIVNYLCGLHPGDAMDVIERAFATGKIEPFVASLDTVRKNSARPVEAVLDEFRSGLLRRLGALPQEDLRWYANSTGDIGEPDESFFEPEDTDDSSSGDIDGSSIGYDDFRPRPVPAVDPEQARKQRGEERKKKLDKRKAQKKARKQGRKKNR